jgi:hypothetical protein
MNRAGIFVLIWLLVLSAGNALAQTQDFRFHWAPSPVIDGDGINHPEAVEYQVYLSRDGAADELMATVVGDTTYTLEAEAGVIHRLRVVALDASGNRSPSSEWSDPVYFEASRGNEVPVAAELQQNYPNPFNPETHLVYGIPPEIQTGDQVRLDIFSVDGRLVRTLDIERTPGWHEVVWDGTDNQGRNASTGMYVTRLMVGTMVQTNKMTMIK